MYIAVWESQRPSPLALQKGNLLFAVLCVRYVALRSESVSQTTMLLRLSRPCNFVIVPTTEKENGKNYFLVLTALAADLEA